MENGRIGIDAHLQKDAETDEQFLMRVRSDAREKLSLRRPRLDIEILAAYQSISQVSYFGDLTEKSGVDLTLRRPKL
jgi:hypothetical protein